MSNEGTSDAAECVQEAMPPLGLFEGDTGTLDLDERRALTALVKYPCVEDATLSDVYRTIESEEDLLASRLCDLGLVLHVSAAYRTAWVTQANFDGDREPYKLKGSRALNRDDTILLVNLRVSQHEQEAQGGESWFVSHEDLRDALALGPYADDKDAGRLERGLKAALDHLMTMGYIDRAPTEGYYRIMPVLPAVMTLDRLQEMLALLGAETAEAQVEPEAGHGADDVI